MLGALRLHDEGAVIMPSCHVVSISVGAARPLARADPRLVDKTGIMSDMSRVMADALPRAADPLS